MKFDGQLNIATGLAMTSRIWKNEKIQWSALVSRLMTAIKTSETLKEYNNANKDERSKIKDVGGYVGGYLRAGRRKPENVVHRQLLTLDIDYAHSDFWDNYCMSFNNAAVLHATHSHTEKAPRYRLIMPISREVQNDEYVAIARRVAGWLDIELFDNTTFETNRLMFWPSVSIDVEYYSDYQDGPWIDADAILASYTNWKDSSLWPTSMRNLQEVRDLSKKQQDPEFKRGIIGAFCRTYSIQEAINTFLNNVYIEVNENCYTYVHGSTAAGLKIYDDKFAYSHHGTDPCGGKLCNAFDIVRIHKFGHLDGDNEEHTKSFRAMEDFAREDENVKKTVAHETILEAKYDFQTAYDPAEFNLENENVDWATELEVDSKGNYLSTAGNINTILKHDPRLKGVFKQNSFDSKRYVFKSLPWRAISGPEPFKNVDYSGLRNYIESIYGINSPMKIEDSLTLEFEHNSYNPVKDYLSSIFWDGQKRIDFILIDYFGCPDDAYHREAIRKTLVAAVARIFNPGAKFDLVLTLVGDQGTGKSTLVRRLGKGWSSDSFLTVTGKEAFEQLQGAWLIELAELSGIKKAEIEAIKHFISKQEDIFRPAYQRAPEVFPRQCVFIGTTNNHAFLTDPTGNRRFIPVDIDKSKAAKEIFDLSEDEVDQIWAEAVELFHAGEKLFMSDEALTQAVEEQAGHSVTDERLGLLLKYLDIKLTDDWEEKTIVERCAYLYDFSSANNTNGITRQEVCIAEIWCECLQKPKEEMDRFKTQALHDMMKSLKEWEWQKVPKIFANYGKQKYFVRKAIR